MPRRFFCDDHDVVQFCQTSSQKVGHYRRQRTAGLVLSRRLERQNHNGSIVLQPELVAVLVHQARDQHGDCHRGCCEQRSPNQAGTESPALLHGRPIGCVRFRDTANRCDEAVASARNGSYERRDRVSVMQRLSQLRHGLIDRGGAHDHAAPDAVEQLLRTHDFSGRLRESDQKFHRARFQFVDFARPRNFVERRIDVPLAQEKGRGDVYAGRLICSHGCHHALTQRAEYTHARTKRFIACPSGHREKSFRDS